MESWGHPGIKNSPPGGEASCDWIGVRWNLNSREWDERPTDHESETYIQISPPRLDFTSRWPVSPLGGEISVPIEIRTSHHCFCLRVCSWWWGENLTSPWFNNLTSKSIIFYYKINVLTSPVGGEILTLGWPHASIAPLVASRTCLESFGCCVWSQFWPPTSTPCSHSYNFNKSFLCLRSYFHAC